MKTTLYFQKGQCIGGSMPVNNEKDFSLYTNEQVNILERLGKIKSACTTHADKIGFVGDEICDWTSGNISDILLEIAQNAADIYDGDAWEWAAANYSKVNDYLREFLTDENPITTKDDFISTLNAAKSHIVFENLMANKQEIAEIYLYNALLHVGKLESITSSQAINLELAALDAETLDELNDALREQFNIIIE